ncbi:hypothetical protein QUA81_10990 [Microcoleus sp. F6_B4]
MTVSNQQLNAVRPKLCPWWRGVDFLLVTAPGIIGQSVQVIRSFARLHSQSLASVKQAGNIYQMPASESIGFLPAGSNSRASTFYIPNKGHQKAASTLWGVSLQKTAARIRRYSWKIDFCEISADVQNKQKYSQK